MNNCCEQRSKLSYSSTQCYHRYTVVVISQCHSFQHKDFLRPLAQNLILIVHAILPHWQVIHCYNVYSEGAIRSLNWGSHSQCQVWEICGGNSRNSRCQVWTYKMLEGTLASAYVLHPFQTLVPRFWNREDGRWEDWRIRERIRVVLRVELGGWVIEVRTYSIFELKYLHDMSKVFMLSIRINKEINQRTINKQNP